MRKSTAAALCVALLACAAGIAAAQAPAAAPKAAPPAEEVVVVEEEQSPRGQPAPAEAREAKTFEETTPRGPPLAKAPVVAVPGGPSVGPMPPGSLPPGVVPPGAAPAEPVCECPLPADGGGYFGRGKDLTEEGCECRNACQFSNAPNGAPRPSCATLCTCPHAVKVQTFNVKRGGALIREYPVSGRYIHGRRLFVTSE